MPGKTPLRVLFCRVITPTYVVLERPFTVDSANLPSQTRKPTYLEMAWSSPDSWLTRLFSGDPIAILISFLVTIALPALLHWYFYTTSPRTSHTPTFLLLGPSGSGKTSLVSLLQHRFSANAENESAEASPTRISQVPSTINLLLPLTVPLGSNKYRSENDFEVSEAKSKATKYAVIDTPGHGKLRAEHALAQFSNPSICGVIFMVDSAALDAADITTDDVTRDTAVYLHDTLLALQRRKTKGKAKTDINVLVATNKQDLFTALPPGAIRSKLQDEIEKVRRSKSKGISSVDRDPDQDVDEDDILGGGGEEKFSFKTMEEEYGLTVDVIGGSVRGEEAGKGVNRWEEWIGSCL